jgi:hypothetical protein
MVDRLPIIIGGGLVIWLALSAVVATYGRDRGSPLVADLCERVLHRLADNAPGWSRLRLDRSMQDRVNNRNGVDRSQERDHPGEVFP